MPVITISLGHALAKSVIDYYKCQCLTSIGQALAMSLISIGQASAMSVFDLYKTGVGNIIV